MSDEKNNGIPIFKMPNSALCSVQEKDIFKTKFISAIKDILTLSRKSYMC